MARFDYSIWAQDTASAAQAAALRIREGTGKESRQMIAIGQDLLAVKTAVPHGDFGSWLAAEFSMSRRTAGDYMNVARLVAKSAMLADLPPADLRRLAAPSTPESVINRVVAALEDYGAPGDVEAIIAEEKAKAGTPSTKVGHLRKAARLLATAMPEADLKLLHVAARDAGLVDFAQAVEAVIEGAGQ